MSLKKSSGWRDEEDEESVPMLSHDHVGNGWVDDRDQKHLDDDTNDSEEEVLVRQLNGGEEKQFVNVSKS